MFELLSAISDGISDDFSYAVNVLSDEGFGGIELQTVGGRNVGDLSVAEIRSAKRTASDAGLEVVCLSHKNLFGSLSVRTAKTGDQRYQDELDTLRRLIGHAHEAGTTVIRIMSFQKEMVLFGTACVSGSVITGGAWANLVSLMKPPVRLAESEGVQLVVETCLKGMITSAKLAARLVDEIGSPALKVLWDPCNALYFNESAYPAGYEALHKHYIGHVHIKDAVVDIPSASMDITEVGKGDMGQYLESIAMRLKADHYTGHISLENIHRPANGNAEVAFRASARKLKEVFQ
jgi:L-ribulose-5-phosphate 3-epimerase